MTMDGYCCFWVLEVTFRYLSSGLSGIKQWRRKRVCSSFFQWNFNRVSAKASLAGFKEGFDRARDGTMHKIRTPWSNSSNCDEKVRRSSDYWVSLLVGSWKMP